MIKGLLGRQGWGRTARGEGVREPPEWGRGGLMTTGNIPALLLTLHLVQGERKFQLTCSRKGKGSSHFCCRRKPDFQL